MCTWSHDMGCVSGRRIMVLAIQKATPARIAFLFQGFHVFSNVLDSGKNFWMLDGEAFEVLAPFQPLLRKRQVNAESSIHFGCSKEFMEFCATAPEPRPQHKRSELWVFLVSATIQYEQRGPAAAPETMCYMRGFT